MRNILVISVNWLGDVIFSTPVYKALKDNYPGAKITVLAVPRVKDVLLMCPFVDDVIVYDEDGEDRPLWNKLLTVLRLRRRHFDAVFILRSSLSRTFLTMLAGIPRRVGLRSRKGIDFLTHALSDAGLDDLHRTDTYLKILEGYGLKISDRSTRLQVDPSFLSWAERFLEGWGVGRGEPFAVLNTGGNWGLKQWPLENFAELARRITSMMGMKVLLPGAIKDAERVERIARLSGPKTIAVAGGTSLGELAAIFQRAKFLVSADSGPLHLANAVGTDVVGLFGPTRPEITGPRGPGRVFILQKDAGCNHAPCYYLECLDNKCMKGITVDDVLQIIQKL